MGYPEGARNSFLDSHITGALTLAAYSVLPNDEGVGGTEVTGGTYARPTHSAWNAAAAGIKTNNGVIDFGVPSPVTIVGVGVWDGATFKGISVGFSAAVLASTTAVQIADGAGQFRFLTP